jgi:hypothetical protein
VFASATLLKAATRPAKPPPPYAATAASRSAFVGVTAAEANSAVTYSEAPSDVGKFSTKASEAARLSA